jgi:AraC-like DNA-binding protein
MAQTAGAIIILFGACLSLLTSLGQLTLRERRVENYNLAALFLVLGLALLQAWGVITGLALDRPDLLFMNLTFFYLLGPIFFTAYYYVIFPASSFPVKKVLLFLPAAAAFAGDMYYLLLPAGDKAAIMGSMFSGESHGIIPLFRAALAGSSAQMVLMLSWLLALLVREKRRHDHGSIITVDIAYTVFTMAAHMVLVSGVVLGSQTIISLGGVTASLLLVAAYVVGFRFPEFLQLLITKASKKKSKPPLTGVDKGQTMEQLMKLMRDDKAYSEEDVKLQDIADELSLTIHQLSHLINEGFSMNFNNFINRFRVDEALRLLIDEPSRSIISIAHDVGFSSKSAFYAAFTRFTGTNPTQFRRQNAGKDPSGNPEL